MRYAVRTLLCSWLATIMLNSSANAQSPLLVDITVNGQPFGTSILLVNADDAYYASISDLTEWGVRGPYIDVVTYDDREYARLRSLGELTVRYEQRTASATIHVPPELLPRQQVNVRRASSPNTVTSTGAYLDYNWAVTSADRSSLTGLLAPTFFGSAGVIDAQILYQDARSTGFDGDSTGSNWLRLNTTFTRDLPDRMQSLRIGDVISAPGLWGSGSRIGGVQYSSNFATQPGFVSMPVPTLNGVATLPSTLDLYVDGSLRHHQDLNPGAFRVDNVPVITGAGEVQMVVTDILGREHIYSQDFYASRELLRQGLSDFAYTIGAVRRGYGQPTDRYDETVLLAEHRYGVNNELTVGGRAGLGSDAAQASASLDWSRRLSGVVSVGLGLSNSDSGSGSAWLVGYRYQARSFSVYARATGTSEHFTDIGAEYPGRVPRSEFLLGGSWRRPAIGSFGLAFVHTDYHDSPARDITTLNYSKTVFRNFYLSFFASFAKQETSTRSVGVTINRNFGARRSASASVSRDGGSSDVRMETRSNLPAGPGIGYRIGTTVGNQERVDGQFIGQTDFGRYTLEGDRFGSNTAVRARASGSLAWLAGRPYAAREINDGFAVARIGELENVRVYLENQEVGRSDKNGRLLLPQLRPYEANRIRIEPNDLPLASEVRTISMAVAPAFRSGLVIEFPVSTPSFAMARAKLESGEFVPEGAVVQIEGKTESSIVGLEGALFISGPQGDTNVSVEWQDQRCGFSITLAPSDQALPHLGDVTCFVQP